MNHDTKNYESNKNYELLYQIGLKLKEVLTTTIKKFLGSRCWKLWESPQSKILVFLKAILAKLKFVMTELSMHLNHITSADDNK